MSDKYRKGTTVRFRASDEAAIADIMKKYKLYTKLEAIQLALYFTSIGKILSPEEFPQHGQYEEINDNASEKDEEILG